MFGLFKKKNKEADMFADGQWSVAQGEYDGQPILVRFNSNLKPFVGKTDHNVKIGFAIPLNTPNPGGMPTPEENAQFNDIEDQIFESLSSRGSVVQALTITMGTFKEFVFYSEQGLDIKSAHEDLMQKITTHEIQCMAEIENEWETYTNWVEC